MSRAEQQRIARRAMSRIRNEARAMYRQREAEEVGREGEDEA
jgi:hypothetical protein